MKQNVEYIINEELLKLYSNISRNVGVDKVIPYLNLSQPFYIVPILGQPLFDELVGQINTDTLTEVNKALILKIAPPLSLWTDYLAVRSLPFTITQKGITKEKSENSESISKDELGYYLEGIKESAEMATKLLVEYLCKCMHNYPKWRPQKECQCEKYQDTEGTTDTPFKPMIYFPSGRSNKCKNKCGRN